MAAGIYDLRMKKGVTYYRIFEYFAANPSNPNIPGDPIDLSGYDAILEVRRDYCEDVNTPPVLRVSSFTGEITFDEHRIIVKIPESLMNSAEPGKHVYNLILFNDAGSDDFLEGRCLIAPNTVIVPR